MASFVDDERFDGLYLNIADATRGIEPLLDTVFSFLRRKTDFFAGPPGSEKGTEAALAKVQEVAKKHAEIYLKSKEKIESKMASSRTPSSPKKVEADVIEMGKDGDFDVSTPKPKLVPEKKRSTVPEKTSSTESEADSSKNLKSSEAETGNSTGDDDSRGPAPAGNGGTVDGLYTWTQILSEVNVTVPVPENTRGRDLNVTISKKRLKVGLRKTPGEFIIDAPLTKAVIVDDSFWTVEDGNRLVINLQKLNQMEWWDSVCEGDPKINVRDINPESSKLSDLDGETRKTVEKMMYDQRQKAMGLPSSEEEQKMAMFEKFKKEHPELDFSNAKLS